VDWLVDIAEEFKLQRATLYLSVRLLDRALDVLPMRREKLQLLGCACVLIAAKLEEVSFLKNLFVDRLASVLSRCIL
jgi:hypothetical protein